MKKKTIITCECFEKTQKYLLVPTDNSLQGGRKLPTSRRSFKTEGEAGKKNL